jgi:hypothetical protein
LIGKLNAPVGFKNHTATPFTLFLKEQNVPFKLKLIGLMFGITANLKMWHKILKVLTAYSKSGLYTSNDDRILVPKISILVMELEEDLIF